MTNKGNLIKSIYASALTQRATLVAFYLINRADQENTCFPSVKTIAKECNISTRTVQRAVNDLEEAGFLVRESRFHDQGGQRSNLFHLSDIGFDSEMEEDKFELVSDEETHETNEELAEIDYPLNQIPEKFQKKVIMKDVDIAVITFEGILKDNLSQTPCQDGIP